MRFWLMCLFAASLFGQSLNIPSGTSIYYIDPSNRGKDIVNMITTLSSSPFTSSPYNNSEIAIQTRMPGPNGQWLLIRYVTSANVKATTNSTILIIGQPTSKGGSNATLTFYVVPVEQIVEVIYSAYNTLPNGSSYSTTITTGVLPLYNFNLSQRAADIINVFSVIKANASYYRYKSSSYFTMQTSLSGTFNPPLLAGGVIPYVQCVGLTPTNLCSTSGITTLASNGTLLYITYNSTNVLTHAYYLIAGTEQIYGINYFPNP
ncbi:MAG: hypothetical protein K1X28_09885 [Parachlamydiales bacterium]|nr:hypothetical protein [Parachlamydiales bacterium]